MAKKANCPDVKKGSRVNVVSAHNQQVPARVISDGADDAGRIDLAVEGHERYGDFTITKAPHDPTAQQHDSWNVPAAVEAPKQPATPQK